MVSKFRYHKDGSLPEIGTEVLVFGSNESGVHGAGAARLAYDCYGAKIRCGFGPMGNSFAVPTKDWNIGPLSLSDIKFYVNRFIAYTHFKDSHDISYFLTSLGCGLAGHSPSDIAPMFKDCDPSKFSFPDTWQEFLED